MVPSTFPDTWAWDMHDLLLTGEDARAALAAAHGAEALVRQRDKINESLASLENDGLEHNPPTGG